MICEVKNYKGAKCLVIIVWELFFGTIPYRNFEFDSTVVEGEVVGYYFEISFLADGVGVEGDEGGFAGVFVTN